MLGLVDLPDTVCFAIMDYASFGGIPLAAASRACRRLVMPTLFRLQEKPCKRAAIMLRRLDQAGREMVTLVNGEQMPWRDYDYYVAAWGAACCDFREDLRKQVRGGSLDYDTHQLYRRITYAMWDNRLGSMVGNVNARLWRFAAWRRQHKILFDRRHVAQVRAASEGVLLTGFLLPRDFNYQNSVGVHDIEPPRGKWEWTNPGAKNDRQGFQFESNYTFGTRSIQMAFRVGTIQEYIVLRLFPRVDEVQGRPSPRAYGLWCSGLNPSCRGQRAESIYFGERGHPTTRM